MSVPRFWREIPQRYNLQASQCGVCEEISFPPREICPTCRRESVGHMKSMKLSGNGVVLEWTRVHKAAPGYDMQVPYLLALIKTPEGPVITGQVVDFDGTLTPGTPVKGVFRRLASDGESGVIYYGTKWVVVPPEPTTEPAPTETKPKRTFRKKAKTKAAEEK